MEASGWRSGSANLHIHGNLANPQAGDLARWLDQPFNTVEPGQQGSGVADGVRKLYRVAWEGTPELRRVLPPGWELIERKPYSGISTTPQSQQGDSWLAQKYLYSRRPNQSSPMRKQDF